MKKIFLILGLCTMMIAPISAKDIVVLKVTKTGDGWQNLFNLYGTVTTTYLYNQGSTRYVNLDCEGSGFNWCRASRNIGEYSTGGVDEDNILSNAQFVQAINDLIEASERAYASKGQLNGSKTLKIAVRRSDKSQLYFVKADWRYRTGDNPEAKITITISTDDNSLLERRN